MKPVIKLENISRKYLLEHRKEKYLFLKESTSEEFYALKNISFQVQQGECLGVIGENGSGKTTLLKIIGGVITPSSGSVHVDGSILSFLDINAGLQEELTGRENIFLYGSLLGFSKMEIKKKFDKIISFSNLAKFIDVRLKHYSTGMKVRLAFAVALSHAPDVLLIDEIMAVGDEAFQKKSYSKIKLLKKEGKTIVFVSHNLHVVKDICDKVLYLKNGKVENINSPEIVIFNYLKDVADNKHNKIKLDKHNDDVQSVTELELKEKSIERDIKLLEEDYGQHKNEDVENSIVSLINKDINIKKKRIKLLKEEQEKIDVLEQIRYLLNKKITYTLEPGAKRETYSEIASILLQNIRFSSNPYEKSFLISNLMNIFSQLNGQVGHLKKEVDLILKEDIEIKDVLHIREYYEKLCLKFQFYPSDIETVRESISILEENIIKIASSNNKSKEKVIQFILGELDNKLNEKGYNLVLKSVIVETFLKILLSIDYKPQTKEERAIIKESCISLCAQIEQHIIKLKQKDNLTIKEDTKKKISQYSSIKRSVSDYRRELTAPQKEKNSKVKITDVLFKNKQGRKSNKFHTNEPLTVEIHYEAKRKIENPTFGIAFYSEEGFHIYGPNTKFHDFKINSIEGKGKVKFVVDKLPLLQGTYFVSVAVHPFDSFEHYDLHDKKESFVVESPNMNSFGFIHMDSKWEKS